MSKTWRPALVLLAFAALMTLALDPLGRGSGSASAARVDTEARRSADPVRPGGAVRPGPARQASPLTEPGNAAFAAVAEVVRELEARRDTDWSRVDLEALRRHLRDMERFTLDAEVVGREEIAGGLRVTVGGPDQGTRQAVRRTLQAHAPMLERETGWDARVEVEGEHAALTVTADRPGDVARIRGLGYIGLMATGAHHTRHHWMIATGRHPHGGGG